MSQNSIEVSPFIDLYTEDYVVSADMQASITKATEFAYAKIADSHVSPSDVRFMQVCYDATNFMVQSLVADGYNARHETHTDKESFGNQNYPVIETPEGVEVVADPTWQLYVPKENRTSDLPHVLVGTRDQVIQFARTHGVDDNKLKLWEKESVKKGVVAADAAAVAAADEAAADGGWEAFVDGTGREVKMPHGVISRHRGRKVYMHDDVPRNIFGRPKNDKDAW
ncbi:MAG TPA: hypothetical protein VLE69_02045 [Candidatus Saccharimonadales bacterium]|nr:hypothetical protein [Candidatus Saccharimonadales bacterium]